ncbi:soluble NSF attachment protein alpha isoform [Cavenderia fasciculata]|uniref:Soluble NSF attachment protein alpha isoform n=1 Tax=Cavenderia fasciculata TaxID=261658 RepID=F4QF51_CACFS|nr:soluble NSF attachment protein alpha isoform [Cavenderia fasciculata]EGG14205.1 soluble NSF attachment protein alpha isoform [Cavenderia fasciculata]|eukprot:XP_004350913.1 soluble NSF attachment protein alpha isoform [Cavenderia fasciculata]
MGDEAKAKEFLDKAEKKAKSASSGLGKLFGGGSSKLEDAADEFTKAGNLYKMAKKWDQAGAAFQRAAECYIKSSKHDSAQAYISASQCFKKGNVSSAVTCLKAAIEYYTDEGRFAIAANHQKELAEMYEAEGDLDQACQCYQTAADFYEGESSSVSSQQCLLKIAQISAQLERFERAIEIYEKVAAGSLDNNLKQFGVKEYFLRAILCYLANDDLVGGERALQRYKDMQASFSSSRECRLLEDIIAACRKNNVEEFTDAIGEFNSVTQLDAWKTAVLLKVKQTLTKEESVQ